MTFVRDIPNKKEALRQLKALVAKKILLNIVATFFICSFIAVGTFVFLFVDLDSYSGTTYTGNFEYEARSTQVEIQQPTAIPEEIVAPPPSPVISEPAPPPRAPEPEVPLEPIPRPSISSERTQTYIPTYGGELDSQGSRTACVQLRYYGKGGDNVTVIGRGLTVRGVLGGPPTSYSRTLVDRQLPFAFIAHENFGGFKLCGPSGVEPYFSIESTPEIQEVAPTTYPIVTSFGREVTEEKLWEQGIQPGDMVEIWVEGASATVSAYWPNGALDTSGSLNGKPLPIRVPYQQHTRLDINSTNPNAEVRMRLVN